MTPAATPAPLEVFLLGEVPFEAAQHLQRRLAYDAGETGAGALLLCEHPPTISVGRSGSRAHLKPDDDELRERGLHVHWVNRGGGVVLHLPGQLVGDLVLPLAPLGLDVQGYLDRLHAALVAALAEFDLPGAAPRADHPGVFLGRARVASVGVSVNRWIARHGFTLNVGPYLGPFAILEEPGPGGLPLRQTSMEARRGRPAPMAKVREALVRHLEAALGLERHHVYTDHPILRREAQPRVYAQRVG